jgi:cytochrome c peroxidase
MKSFFGATVALTVAAALCWNSAAEQPKANAKGLPDLTSAQIYVLPAAKATGDKLSLDEIKTFLSDPKNHQPFVPKAPLGLGPIAGLIPADNPMTRAKVELGRQLYFDGRLSRDGTVACATCHEPANGWAQHSAVATGIEGQKGGRNSPTVMNRIFGKTQFWDGRAASLEEQALGPIQNPIEMGFTLPELMTRLKGIEGYKIQFDKVFGGVTPEAVAKAIAAFERTVLVGGSAYDYAEAAKPFAKLTKEDLEEDKELAAKYAKVMKDAKDHPMSESAQRGQALFFGKANCSLCHVGVNLSDEDFYNIGVGMKEKEPNPGRAAVTKTEVMTGAYKTPGLRNIALSAPYMHDGSEKTLAEVVEYYDKGGEPNKFLHMRIKKLNLTQQEKADLVAFMEALTGNVAKVPAPKLP